MTRVHGDVAPGHARPGATGAARNARDGTLTTALPPASIGYAAWRAAMQNLRRNPLALREPDPPPYWRVALSAVDILSILQGSARESGEPLALS